MFKDKFFLVTKSINVSNFNIFSHICPNSSQLSDISCQNPFILNSTTMLPLQQVANENLFIFSSPFLRFSEGSKVSISFDSSKLKQMGFVYKHMMDVIIDDSVKNARKLGVLN